VGCRLPLQGCRVGFDSRCLHQTLSRADRAVIWGKAEQGAPALTVNQRLARFDSGAPSHSTRPSSNWTRNLGSQPRQCGFDFHWPRQVRPRSSEDEYLATNEDDGSSNLPVGSTLSARRLAWYGTCFGYRNNGSSNLSAQTKQALNCATLALDTGVAVCNIRVGLEFRSEPQAFPYPHDDWDCRYCVRSLDIKAEPQKRPLPFRMGRSQVRILSANASWL
jgi:hypothetical protein